MRRRMTTSIARNGSQMQYWHISLNLFFLIKELTAATS
jgi:hypothetical protein